MSILITGGMGFIGRYVIDRLLDRGEAVVSYDRAPKNAGFPTGVTSVQGELFDVSRLAATITEHDVDAIVHSAGMSDPALSVGMPTATVAANGLGTMHVLEASRHAGFAGRVVLLSSATVYGCVQGAIDESSPIGPHTPHAASKAFGDLLAQVYVQNYGLDVVSLRLTEVYGPGRSAPSVVHRIVDASVRRHSLRLATRPRQPYHLVHVEDAARAIVATLDTAAPKSRIFDIAGERVPVEQVLAIVRDRLPDSDIELGAGEPVHLAPLGPIVGKAAYDELGYRPRWGLARGIDDLCAWLEAEEAC